MIDRWVIDGIELFAAMLIHSLMIYARKKKLFGNAGTGEPAKASQMLSFASMIDYRL